MSYTYNVPFRAYTAHIRVPKAREDQRTNLRAKIHAIYPGMKLEFSDAPEVSLIGVNAPDKESAKIVVPQIDKLIKDVLNQSRN